MVLALHPTRPSSAQSGYFLSLHQKKDSVLFPWPCWASFVQTWLGAGRPGGLLCVKLVSSVMLGPWALASSSVSRGDWAGRLLLFLPDLYFSAVSMLERVGWLCLIYILSHIAQRSQWYKQIRVFCCWFCFVLFYYLLVLFTTPPDV